MVLEKCPDCHKHWERTWNGTEYCPECGQTKEQAAERIERERAESRKTTSPLQSFPSPGRAGGGRG